MDIADIQQKADKGNILYQFLLGVHYCEGLKVAQDIDKGIKLARSAADQGLTRAAMYLAKLYESGKIVKQDYEKALEYYQDAAWKGEFMALIKLGIFYYYGYGTEANPDIAGYYFEKAMTRDDNIDKLAIAEKFKTGTEGFPRIPRYAYAWYILGKAEPEKINSLQNNMPQEEVENARKLLAELKSGIIF